MLRKYSIFEDVMILPPEWDDARREWEDKYESAVSYMESRPRSGRVLLEIAAQHPLVNGLYPNKEFAARLRLGIELYQHHVHDQADVEIYVPGSRHVFDGVADKVSLSSAGIAYLIQNGIPAAVLHGDDLNARYKAEDGVYNSADECFVAASYFKNSNFETLASVVSPGQLIRKTLHYIAFGVIPLTYTAPVKLAFHGYMDELFTEIPFVLLVDATLQDPGSEKAERLRQERRPKEST